MVNKDFFMALDDLEREMHISREVFISSLEAGISSAYKKETGDNRPVMIKITPDKFKIQIFVYQTIVDEVVDPDKEISLADAKQIKKTAKVGEIISSEISPKMFTRIAAQTAKQVVVQRLTDAKKEQVLEEMNDKEGEILSAIVRRVEGNTVYVEIMSTQMEGIMGQQDQLAGEKYNVGDIIKVYVKRLKVNNYGTQVLVSRSSPGFVRRMFETEVPEIKSGVVQIKKVVREAGNRSKIAVYSDDPDVDAVGACIGPKGTRIGAIVKELNGERIDVIPWSSNPLEFIAAAISPAKAAFVQVNNEVDSASVYVNEDMLSLAIGREGQNARLAAKLTDWKIDIKPYTAVGGIFEE
jgi:N utilization substance protein A